MKLHIRTTLAGIAALLFSVGCSNTTNAYYNTLRLALEDRSINLTVDEIKNSKADLIEIKAGVRDTAALALAYIEDNKHKWVSGDNAVLTMHHGLITHTDGLKADLYFTGDLNNNPLANDPFSSQRWERKVDVEDVGYGLTVESSWKVEGEITREYIGFQVPLIKVVESVSFPAHSPFINLDLHWENTYYFHQATKELMASKQKFSPKGDEYVMVYLSRIVREMDKQGAAK